MAIGNSLVNPATSRHANSPQRLWLNAYQNKAGKLVEKNSRNSLKLSETLSELEAALSEWDNLKSDLEMGMESVDSPRTRAQDLLHKLKLQLASLSEESP